MELKSKVESDENSDEVVTDKEYIVSNETKTAESCVLSVKVERELKVLLTPLDYVLGVQDLTGELMRHCINSLSSGRLDEMYKVCNFVKDVYSGLSSLFRVPSKDFQRKLHVLRQSLLKIENACYMVCIRGSEIPKHMLADVMTYQDNNPVEEDEGFF